MYIYNNTNKSPIYICNIRINTPKKRKIFTFVICCISFLSLFSFHSLILRFPPSGCFYLQSLPSFRFVRIARALYIYQLRILHYIYNMYARAVITSMCKYIHAHTFVPLAILALACPDACFFVSCFFVLAGLSALPFADFHFLLDCAMATDSSGTTCFRFPMNPFPGESFASIFFFRLLFFSIRLSAFNSFHPPFSSSNSSVA